eukprot:4219327-Pyramimonas_sp.AAC.1
MDAARSLSRSGWRAACATASRSAKSSADARVGELIAARCNMATSFVRNLPAVAPRGPPRRSWAALRQ